MSGSIGDNPYRASGVVAAAGGGGLEWCSCIQSTAFCASAGKGYFVNTCGGGVTVTLPATASAGDTIEFKDYKRTWATACKELTVNTNSLNFQGEASTDVIAYETAGEAVSIVYADATRGWMPTVMGDTLCKNTYDIQFQVIAGGGGAGWIYAGGGAGGYRTVASKNFKVNPGNTYPITVGGGGSGAVGPSSVTKSEGLGSNGTNSVFGTITSAGGGAGISAEGGGDANDGGSGGGQGYQPPIGAAGSGNVPSTTCTPSGVQGYPGGVTTGGGGGGGGGGATTAGGDGVGASAYSGGPGGTGGTSCISGSPVQRAGGGGGTGIQSGGTATGGGGAGMAYYPSTGNPGTENTGGGAGGGTAMGISGGSGIVILRRLTADSCSTSGTVTTSGCDTIHTFTGAGTFVA